MLFYLVRPTAFRVLPSPLTIMKDIIRDSPVGQLINCLSGGYYLPYSDQRSDYIIPAHFLLPASTSKIKVASVDVRQDVVHPESCLSTATLPYINGGDHGRDKDDVGVRALVFDSHLVGWNGDNDPENPRCVHSSFLLD